MNRTALALSVAFALVLPAGPALAGSQQHPVFALHVAPHASKVGQACTTAKPTVECTQYTVTGDLQTAYDVYLVVAGVDDDNIRNILGASCGVEYDPAPGSGVDVFDWTLCADGLDFPNSGPYGEWPESGGGNRMTWVTCQSQPIGQSVHAIFGAFYVYAYSADNLRVIPNRNLGSGPELRISDCAGAEFLVDTLGVYTAVAAVGGGAPANPGHEQEVGLCEVSPDGYDFGFVPVGDSADVAVTVSNVAPPGGGPIVLDIRELCDDFEIVSGGGGVILSPGTSHEFVVRFSPTSPGTRICSVEVGSECSTVELTGNTEPEIELGGTERATSEALFSSAGATTEHALVVPTPPAAGMDGTLTVRVEGYFRRTTLDWRVRVVLEGGHTLGYMAGSGYDRCISRTNSFPVSAARLATAAEDGVVEVTIVNDPLIKATCSTNKVTVTLDYQSGPGPLTFGQVFAGGTHTRAMRVTNLGYADLDISELGVTGEAFTADLTPFTLAPGETRLVDVHFAPTNPGNYSGTMYIRSNDPDESELTVDLNGTGVEPPLGVLEPTQLLYDLLTGEEESQTVTLSNDGGLDLTFQLELPPPPPPPPPAGPGRMALHVSSGIPSSKVCLPEPTGSLPSSTPCSEYNVEGNLFTPYLVYLTANSNEDGVAALSCGVEYPSGVGVFSWYLCTDGLQFTNGGWPDSGGGNRITWATCQTEPLGAAGVHAIAGAFYIYAYGNGLFSITPNRNLPIPEYVYGTCEAVLVNLDSTQTPAAAFSSGGLLYGHNPCLESTSAAAAQAVAPWLSVFPLEGTVPPGESLDLAVTADASGLYGGHYEADVTLYTNDPLHETLLLPVSVDVTGAPDIAVSTEALDLGEVVIGLEATATFTVENVGTDVLDVTGITSDRPEFVVQPSTFTLAPGSAQNVIVTFAPLAPGFLTATLTLASNDPDSGILTVALAGTGLTPAEFSISPTSASETLVGRAQATQTLSIKNSGGVDLTFDIRAQPSASALPAFSPTPPVGLEPVPEAGSGASEGEEPSCSTGRRPLRAPHLAGVPPGSGGGLSLLIVYAGDVSEIASYLSLFPEIGTVAQFDARYATPELADLQAFEVVLLGSSTYFYDSELLGDVLADYADQGGGILLTVPTFVPGFAIRGRFLDEGYMPVALGSGFYGPATLGTFDPYHPIMADVTTLTGDVLVSTSPVPGASLVASWSNDFPLVVTGENVVAVNAYVGTSGYWTGDLPLLLKNAAVWAAGGASWLSLAPRSGVVPPGGTVTLDLRFDSSSLFEGDYAADLRLTTNDPDEEEVPFPVTLRVIGAPDISVAGEAVLIQSEQDYFESGAVTQHQLVLPIEPAGPGMLELLVDGDYGFTPEEASLWVEGHLLGSVGGAVGSDCLPASGQFPLDPELWTEITADGVIEAEVRNGIEVNVFCAINRHTVRLHYQRSADVLAFESTYLGGTAERTLVVGNNGTATLSLNGIATSTADFGTDPTSLEIPPRETRELRVLFHPTEAGPRTDVLSLASNDPDEPEILISLSGEGVSPPVAAVTPDSFEETLSSGSGTARTLRIDNTGLSPLDYGVSVSFAPQGLLSLPPSPPAAGERPGGGSRPEPPSAAPTVAFLDAFLASIPPSSILFHDDMESGPGGWSVKPIAPDALWHRTERSANSPVTSWWCGIEGGSDYGTGRRIQTTLVGPALDLTGAVSPITLQFFEFFETEPGWDFCMLDVSNDGAKTWFPLRGGPGTAPSGSSGGWVLSQYDLSSYQGETIRFRFHFDTLDGVANSYPGWFVDDVLVTTGQAAFLTVTPTAGTVLPGEGDDLSVAFDAGGLLGGDYDAQLRVATNDPANPLVVVPALLHVVGVPELVLSAESVDFGVVFVGESAERRLTILNNGTEPLNVAGITTEGEGFSADPAGFQLLPGGQRILPIGFSSSLVGPNPGSLLIQSDDPDRPQAAVPLYAQTLLPPAGSLAPTSIVSSLFTNETETQPATVANDGASDLLVAVDFVEIAEPSVPAGPGPKLALHTQAHTTKFVNACIPADQGGPAPTLVPCTDYETRGQFGVAYDVYLTVINDGGGVRGVSCGVDYESAPGQGMFVGEWRSCADLEFPNAGPAGQWPAPGGGNRITWATCQDDFVPGHDPLGTHTIAGAFYVYAYGAAQFEITENRNVFSGPELQISDCFGAQVEVSPAATGRVRFTADGLLPGRNPCLEGSSAPEPVESLLLAKGDPDPRPGFVVAEGRGGPDGFGHTWIDSDDPEGPRFAWVDARQEGEAVPLAGDDEVSPPMLIGFAFPFYGGSFNYVRVTSNGYLSFANDPVQYSNQPLPSPGAPRFLVAVLWDDLVVEEGQVFMDGDEHRLVVQYQEVRSLSGEGPYTFQVILEDDGAIHFQYLTLGGPVTGATVGIQDGEGSDGLLVAFNSSYLHEDLAVALARRPAWARVDPVRSVVAPGESLDLLVTTDAASLPGGTYEALMKVETNDPDREHISVPVVLSVTPRPVLELSASSLDFGHVPVGGEATRLLTVTNRGFVDLDVTEVTIEGDAFETGSGPFLLAPGQSRNLSIVFRPPTVDLHAGDLRLASNDPEVPSAVVSLSGRGDPTPRLEVSVDPIRVELPTGGEATRLLRLGNTGGARLDLAFHAGAVDGQAVEIQPGRERDRIVSTGRAVPVERVADTGGDLVPPTLRMGEARPLGDGAVLASAGGGGEVVTGLEVFGNRDYAFSGSGRFRGNAFRCTSPVNLQEHRFYLSPITTAPMWFVVYEGAAAEGTFELISAAEIAEPGSAEGWFSSGPIDVSLEPGRYYIVAAIFQGYCTYYCQQAIQPYPVPASFGELQAAVGWSWAPPTVVPPAESFPVPGYLYGEPVAYHQALVTGQGLRWLGFSPETEQIAPGNEVDIQVRFDATGLRGGEYAAEIVVESNDPLLPEVSVPVELLVTDAPDLVVSPSAVGFEQVPVGEAAVRPLTVTNIGYLPLSVSPALEPGLEFALDLTPFTLDPDESRLLEVSFAPGAEGPAVATLALSSNDPDTPITEVMLSGAGIVPPRIVLAPEFLEANLLSGQTASDILTVGNTGGSSLKFDVLTQGNAPLSVASIPRRLWNSPPSGVRDRPPTAEESAGESPPFEGRDLETPGEEPFVFFDGFEDGDFDGWLVGGGGVKEVTDETAAAGTRYSYRESNSPSSHFNGIFREFGSVKPHYAGFYIRSGSVVTHDSYFVLRSSQGLDLIWFFARGSGFLYVNADVGGNESVPYQADTWYHIEFRDIDWTAQNFDYYVDETLIQEDIPFRYSGSVADAYRLDIYNYSGGATAGWDEIVLGDALPASWLSVAPDRGVVPPGGNEAVTVTMDATGLSEGSYTGYLSVLSEDPDEPRLAVPVRLEVKGVPAISVEPVLLSFGPIVVGGIDARPAMITNTGTGDLEVTPSVPGAPEFSVDPTPLVLAPGASRELAVLYLPGAVGSHEAVLELRSNDPAAGLMKVDLAGEALPAPALSVMPSSFRETLVGGEAVFRTLTLANDGEGDLIFSLRTDGGVAAAAAAPELALAGEDLRARGRVVPLSRLREVGRPAVPLHLEVDAGARPDRMAAATLVSAAGPSDLEEVLPGFEVFGGRDQGFLAGPATRGNLFHCSTSTRLLEQRFYLAPTVPTQLWFVVYEGTTPTGTFDLVSAADATPAGPGEGWYGSGPIDVDLEAGRYYLVAVTFSQPTGYFSQGDLTPYPLPTSLGELQAGVGWSWAPTAEFPPPPVLGVPDLLYGESVAYHQALLTESGVAWLRFDRDQGVVGPGAELGIKIILDSRGLTPGAYDAQVVVESNDPVLPQWVIPTHVDVLAAPLPEFVPPELAFGAVPVGEDETMALRVANLGTAAHVVTGIEAGLPDYTVTPGSFTLAPGDSLELLVTFAPVQAGPRDTDLSLAGNAPGSPLVIPLHGSGTPPPVFSVTPSPLAATALPGGEGVRSLTLCNDGAGPVELTLASGPAVYSGADAFGHVWTDSDAPAGPVFEWVDVTGTGTPIFGDYADDESAGPFPIGFPFPYFGETMTEFRVSSNGWVSFTNAQANFHNQSLPRAESTVPENLLAVFWDDLVFDPVLGSQAAFDLDGSRLVIQFTDLCRFEGQEMDFYSFEILLEPDGRITYQYLRLGGTTESATVGIQNAARDDGLLVAYNEAYLYEGLAVEFLKPVDWLGFAPDHVSLGPGECASVAVSFDASSLAEGERRGRFSVVTVPPTFPGYTGEAVLRVGSVEAAVDVKPSSLNPRSGASWVTALVELPPGYDAGDIRPESVRAMGMVPADPGYDVLGDKNNNGLADREFRFARAALLAAFPPQEDVDVVVSGDVGDLAVFVGEDAVRVTRPRLLSPNGGEILPAQGTAQILWETPDGWNPTRVEIQYSADAGVTWSMVAADVGASPYLWSTPPEPTEEGRLQVSLFDEEGALGSDASDGDFRIREGVIGTEPAPEPPLFVLHQNAPNPFTASTVIRYDLPEEAAVTVRFYDVSGRRVQELPQGLQPAGQHAVSWDGRDGSGRPVAAGVYFYELLAGAYRGTRRMLVVR